MPSPRSTSRLALPVAAALAMATACTGTPEAEPTPPPEVVEAQTTAAMERHYTAATTAHTALIWGDLESFKTSLGALARNDLPASAPAELRPLHDKLQQAAADAAGVKDLDEAGTVMGKVAQRCGACHQTVEGGPAYQFPEPPTADDPVKTAMQGHLWAADRLWEGVTGPNEESWTKGAAALETTEAFSAHSNPAIQRKVAVLRTAAGTARDAQSHSDRAATYGRVLAQCGSCHAASGADE